MIETVKALEAQLNQANNPQQKIDALNELAWKIVREERDRAYELSEQAHQLSLTEPFANTPYIPGIAQSLCTKAVIHNLLAEHDQALALAYEALAIIEEHKLHSLMPRALSAIATSYFDLGNYSEALDTYLKQLQISEEIGNNFEQAQALMALGVVYAVRNELDKALNYFEQSLPVFENLGETYWTALTLNNISTVNYQEGNYEEALACIEASLRICREAGAHERIQVIVTTTKGEIYIHLDDPQKALTYFEEALSLSRDGGHPELEVDCLLFAGQAHLKLGNTQQAIELLQGALRLAKQLGHKQEQYESHEHLAQAYRVAGDFEQALTHFEQFHTLKELVFSEASDRNFRNLEVLQRTQAARKEADRYASLYEEEQSRRQLAETMQQVASALVSTLDWQDVLDEILAQLAHLVPYDRGALLLKQGDKLTFVAMRGFPNSGEMLQQEVPLNSRDSDDVFWRIHQTKRPLALEDVASYPGWKQVSNLSFPGAWLGIPLIQFEEVLGMLSLVRDEKVPYDDEAINLATAFAAQAAIVLENARLYNHVKRFSEQLEYEVQARTEALQDAYHQLERLNQTKSDFIAVTAHELRTPLTVVKAYGQLLERDPAIRESEKRHDLVMRIVSGADRLHEIVNTMLIMAKIDSRKLEIFPEPLHINEVIYKIARQLQHDLKERQQILSIAADLEQLPPVEGDTDALKIVFSHLIVNAIKYTPDKGRIRISGRVWERSPQDHLPSNAVEVVITDTGIGIDPSALKLIFTKFYQTGNVTLHSTGRTKFKGGGPGLGLAIARGIIEAHHGQLWAVSEGHDEEKCPGSAFHIVLPLEQPQ